MIDRVDWSVQDRMDAEIDLGGYPVGRQTTTAAAALVVFVVVSTADR
jgi:hypothetical protein